jgi:hypothetical protein
MEDSILSGKKAAKAVVQRVSPGAVPESVAQNVL